MIAEIMIVEIMIVEIMIVELLKCQKNEKNNKSNFWLSILW